MNKIVLKSSDLDGYLNAKDKHSIEIMDAHYHKAIGLFQQITSSKDKAIWEKVKPTLVNLYNIMGKEMQKIVGNEPSLRVYSFETPHEIHGEASRLISKLRDGQTQHHEFVYYIQRAYELLFNLAFGASESHKKNYLITQTPVDLPVQNFAVHKIPDVDHEIENSVMCVMLRGALLPSLIMSKEIQEYSSVDYLSPFALFKIRRDDTKKEVDMEYVLDLRRSYFNLVDLHDKDLFFADPMNATGGSLVTIVKYLTEQGIKPRSIKFFNVICALKGALRIIRALGDVTIYTLWMDPVLNDRGYILPGLGDAGDRLNGRDEEENPRNIIQLIADYGSNICSLYRAQIGKIEQTVLGNH